ncbi:hypothetical protein FRZ44_38160 [Hypericibacter terrae]|uniref:Terminase n=1 Tax=Hypericibacter terrae TaxID=2602015 RepID=A0A5J6MMB9_9PROT|nr:phage terminase small subunit P27 family [Hypericibacter terrae]QEX18509.1 hypothetical protein FRZ44_38160 [Hypericibacter terrae]
MADVVEVADLEDGTPRHLSENAKKFWARVAPELTRVNIVKKSDRQALERYCETLAEWWAIELQLRGKPRVYWTDSAHGRMKRIEPLILVHHRTAKLLLDYEDRLGLNPAARQNILRGMAAQASLPLDNPNGTSSDGGKTEGGEPAGPGSPIGLLAHARTDRLN